MEPNPSHRTRRILIGAGIAITGLCICGILFFSTTLNSRNAQVLSGVRTPTHSSTRAFLLPTSFLTPSGAGAFPTSRQPTTIAAQPTAQPAQPTFADVAPTEAPAQPTASSAQSATGDLKFDYPLTLLVDKDDIVKLEIVSDEPVALAAPLGAPAVSARLLVESDANALAHKTVSYAIPLYRVMSAELATARAEDLNIVAGSEPRQMIAPHDSNFWTWSLVAKRGGEYHVTLRVFGYNQLDDPDPVRHVVDDTRIITVQERGIGERLAQGLADNWLVLFGAGGPIALVILMLTLFFSRRDAAKFKGGP